MRWYLAPLIAVAILSASGPAPALAQETVQVRIDAVDTSSYPQVNATVTVLDPNERPIGDLPPEAFAADVDGVQVPVGGVVRGLDNQVPAAVVLAFDASGSMQGAAIQQAHAAGKALVSRLGSNDQVAVIKFAQGVELVHGFTSDRAQLTSAIDSIQAEQNTALYDGVVAAVGTAQTGAQRRAVVLLSDGQDFGGVSQNSREASLARAQSVGVPFFVVGLGDSVDQAYLQELVNLSRGQLFLAPAPEALQGLYETIGTALRSQYTLTLDLGAVEPATANTLRVHVEGGGRSGAGETVLDLTAFAPQVSPPPAAETSPTATAVPVATPPPAPPPETEDGGASGLLAAGVLGAVLAAGGSAAAGVWLIRRRRPHDDEPVALREPHRGEPGQSVLNASGAVFMGTGPLANGGHAKAWLEVVAPDDLGRFPLGEDPVTVGFTGDCTIHLPNGGGHEGARVRVWRREGRYMLHNLSRLGRVMLAGRPASWAVLEDGDEIVLGAYQMVFHDSAPPAEESSEEPGERGVPSA
jgi:VWFA-related protein